jgi:hypothetical protein
MAEALPKNTSELVALIEKEWDALMQVVERLTPEQMTTPDTGGWSPKDNLAHLGEWMHYMKEAYLFKKPLHEAMSLDEKQAADLDEDGINAVLFERNRNRPAPDVIARLKSIYADILDTLRTTPFADLMEKTRDDAPDDRLVIGGVLGNTSEHFQEHREIIERVWSRK